MLTDNPPYTKNQEGKKKIQLQKIHGPNYSSIFAFTDLLYARSYPSQTISEGGILSHWKILDLIVYCRNRAIKEFK